MQKIEVVLLDLGGVILQLDWARVSYAINCNTLPNGLSLPQFIGSWETYDQYERGLKTTDEFFGSLKDYLKFPGTTRELENHWNKLLVTPVRRIGQALDQLPTEVLIFGLTNSNEAHFEYAIKKFSILKKFKKIFTSFQTGFRKPEKEIFYSTLSELKAEPGTVLFIDDSLKNIEAATQLGINAEYCLNSSAQLLRIFKRYNIIE